MAGWIPRPGVRPASKKATAAPRGPGQTPWNWQKQWQERDLAKKKPKPAPPVKSRDGATPPESA